MNTPLQTDPIASTLAERSTTHGSFNENARIAQLIKNALRSSPNWTALRPVQAEALDMIAHKLGRIAAGDPNFSDHIHDLIGYATLYERSLSPASAVKPASAADESYSVTLDLAPRSHAHFWHDGACPQCNTHASASEIGIMKNCRHLNSARKRFCGDLIYDICPNCRMALAKRSAQAEADAPPSEC